MVGHDEHTAYSLLPYSTHQLRRALTDAADAGFTGVELVEEHLRGLDVIGGAPALRRFASALGLTIVAVGVGVIEEMGDGVDALVLAASEMGANAVIWMPPIRGFGDWPGMVDMARDLEQRASELGMATWCHAPHLATLVETRDEIDRLFAEMPNTRICFDTGHDALFDPDPVGAAERFASRIDHLHLRGLRRSPKEVLGNYLPERTRWEIMLEAGGDFTAPQDGVLDLRPLYAALTEHGFKGWWSIEPPRISDTGGFNAMVNAINGLRRQRERMSG